MPGESLHYLPRAERRSPMMRRLKPASGPFQAIGDFVRRAIDGIGREGLETIAGFIALAAFVAVAGHSIQSESDALPLDLGSKVDVAPRDLPSASDVIEPDDACGRLRELQKRCVFPNAPRDLPTVEGD